MLQERTPAFLVMPLVASCFFGFPPGEAAGEAGEVGKAGEAGEAGKAGKAGEAGEAGSRPSLRQAK